MAQKQQHLAAECIQTLLAHLSKFAEVQAHHVTWIYKHVKYKFYAKDTEVYADDSSKELVFYVCKGLLARTEFIENTDGKLKRKIHTLGLPNRGMMSTEHLFTSSLEAGSIQSLRDSHVLIIPRKKLVELQQKEELFKSFVGALTSKKKRLLSKLRRIALTTGPIQRYIKFAQEFPDLDILLLQAEKEDLLQISRSTIMRANYFMLTGRDKRKENQLKKEEKAKNEKGVSRDTSKGKNSPEL